MHSADDNDCIDMDTYFKNITECCNMLNEKTDTEISLRLWTTLEKPNLFWSKKSYNQKKIIYKCTVTI